MEFEFDKEIDAILRKARENEFAFAGNPKSLHLDADEISAFAENALPEKAKGLYMAHLADCDRCRRILSNIISLNSEAENVPAFVAAEEKILVANAPWYRRLFVFPNLAYSLGALLLIFGGLIGFTLLQSLNKSEISQMSKDAPMQSNSTSAANTVANKMSANTANAVTNTNTASVYSSNSTANVASNSAVSNSTVIQPTVAPNEKRKDAPITENEVALGKVESKPTDGVDKDDVREETQRAKTPKSADEAAKTTDNKQESEANPTVAPYTTRGGITKPNAAKKEQDSTSTERSETTNINGKTFNRRNNVWYDSAYNNQATTNITRGSQEYKKLDQDLRQTVERLGGTVVIVWKSKAYRIQ